ncbi:MAG TPA: hypothetical protein VGE02_15800 [Gemmatimonadales bacterium]
MPHTQTGTSTDPLLDLRSQVLDRDHRHCQACGRRAGDPHPDDTERGVTLDVYHLAPLGAAPVGVPPAEQLQTFCDACAAVRRSHVGRATRDQPPAVSGHMIEALVLAAPPDVQRRIRQALEEVSGI